MPYTIRKRGSKYAIIDKKTGKVKGYSTTRTNAEASIRARLAGEHGWKPKKKRGK